MPIARLLCWSIGLFIASLARPARGLPPAIELDERRPLLASERLDDGPRSSWAEEPAGAPLWLALDTQAGRRASGDSGFAAMLVLGLPLERLAARASSHARFAEAPAPLPAPRAPRPHPEPVAPPPPAELKPPLRPAKAESPLPPPSPKLLASSAPSPPAPLRIPAVVTPLVARAAVDAALRRARLVDPSATIDALASRAHRAALLPELRLRVSRTIDEGQTLSPTEYDPARRTATGGTSLWLEARATWRLDRLLFADEELAFERLREQRAEQRARLSARVLEKLFLWQKANALADDPSASPEDNLAARLHVLEAETELDLLTSGWFSRWRSGAAGASEPEPK